MAHLGLHSSGHLSLHSSGHLGLEGASAIYTLRNEGYIYWRGYSYKAYADYATPALAKAAAMNAAIANIAYFTSGAHVYRPEATLSIDSYLFSCEAHVEVSGMVFKLTPKDGAPFGSPIIPSIVLSRAFGTDGPVQFGSGPVSPTGSPLTWGTALYSGTGATLINTPGDVYLWVTCDLYDWTPWVPVASYEKRTVIGYYVFSGVVSD